MHQPESERSIHFIQETNLSPEDRASFLKQVLIDLRAQLEAGRFDQLLEQISNQSSALISQLAAKHIALEPHPSQNAPLEQLMSLPQDGPMGSSTRKIYRRISDGSGMMVLNAQKAVQVEIYSPHPQLWSELATHLPAETVIELKKAICLVLAEELSHVMQILLGRDEKAQYFISQALRERPAPAEGKIRKRLIELDMLLYLFELGFGQLIHKSLWLRVHEEEYGQTENMVEALKVAVSEEVLAWVK